MSLPVLSSQFFREHQPDVGFFSKWSALFAWNEAILPIYEWQGVLYVGCLQRPSDFPVSDKTIVFLACEPEALGQLWRDYQVQEESTFSDEAEPDFAFPSDSISEAESNSESPSLQPMEIPEGLNSSLEAEKPADENSFGYEALDLSMGSILVPEETAAPEVDLSADTIPTIPEEALVSEETQSPLIAEPAQADPFPALDLSASAPVSPQIAVNPEDRPAVASLDFPLELQDTPDANLNVLSASETENSPDSDSESASASASENDLLDLSGGFQTDATGSIVSPAPPVLTPLSASPLVPAETPDEEVLPAKTASAPAQPKAPIAASEKRASPVHSEVLLGSKTAGLGPKVTSLEKAPALQNQAFLDQVFSQMRTQFSKSMILVKSGDYVKPWKWDENFKPTDSTVQQYSLPTPSPFRIVARTHKPYHGPVYTNDLNQKFFTQWNEAQIPEHLTIVPVIVDDKVVGMILGIGERAANTKSTLQLAEKIATGISKNMQGEPTSQVA